MSTDLPTEHSTPVEFQEIIINSKSFQTKVDVKEVVTNIEIYEHLEKTYLTAVMSVVDADDIISGSNISGGETVIITIKSTRPKTRPVRKKFYIDKMTTSQKTSSNVEFYVFHLVEDIAFLSSLKNVNKSYSGTPQAIIENIFKEIKSDDEDTLEKTIESSSQTDQNSMKVIVPNMSPLDAMSWIKDRACTSKGYPFYLMSTLVDDNLVFVDLETMLKEGSITREPYTYGGDIAGGNDISIGTSDRRAILGYKSSNTENLLSLIKKGLIGAEYQFINPTSNKKNTTVDFDVQEVTKKLSEDLKVDEETSPYPKDYTFSKQKSRIIARAGTTNPYKEGIKSYREVDNEDEGQYKKDIMRESFDSLLKKNPLTILVNGVDFLDGDAHTTIGKLIDIEFARNLAPQRDNYYLDNKKSGAFLIYSAKHSFTPEDYVISFSCVKVDNKRVKAGK